MPRPLPIEAPANRAARWSELAARGVLLAMTALAIALAIAGMIANHRTRPLDWIGLGVAVILAAAAAWIVMRPGRSTRIVCLSFLGVLLAGAPFLDYPAAVVRLYGFVLVNLAAMSLMVPRLGVFLRRHIRWILLGVGLYLIALSFALTARDEWRRYHPAAPAESSPP